MAKKPKKVAAEKQVEALRYQREDTTRKNIPTVELQSVLEKAAQDPVRVAYERRNRDLDPQLVWRGKDGQNCTSSSSYCRSTTPGASAPTRAWWAAYSAHAIERLRRVELA